MFDIHIGTMSNAMEKSIASTLMIALAMKKNNTNTTSLSSIVNPFIKIAEGRSRTYAYSFGDYSATVTLPLHSRVSC